MFWKVWGEYGPLGGDFIAANIEADDAAEARRLFISYVKEHNPLFWKKMGIHNIYIQGDSTDSIDMKFSTNAVYK